MSSFSEKAASPSSFFAFGATALTSLVAGFLLGRLYDSNGTSSDRGRQKGAEEMESEEDENDDHVPSIDLAMSSEECKLVLVVRTDLGMTKGKIAAQCGHATLACYKTLLRQPSSSPFLRRWERHGQAKVALQVKTEEELEILQAKAISLGLCGQIIHDQGRTQIASGSATVLGVGPGPKSLVDQVTGHLKLL